MTDLKIEKKCSVQQLKEKMKINKISQPVLAGVIGVSNTTINQMLNKSTEQHSDNEKLCFDACVAVIDDLAKIKAKARTLMRRERFVEKIQSLERQIIHLKKQLSEANNG